MFKIINIVIFIFYSQNIFSQTEKNNFLSDNNILYINKHKIDSLNIFSINFLEYLTKEQKKSPEINNTIYSKQFEYKYKNGLLQNKSWSYTGIDSGGNNHFKTKTVGFNTYSFVYEDYYIYDNNGKLIRTDQNTPHEINNNFYIFTRVNTENILINEIPAKDFFLANFEDISEIVIELEQNKYLRFEIE